MSSWSYALTNKGRQLQAKAQAGVQLVYTKMAVGSGSLSGQSIEAMTALITPVKNLVIERIRRPPGTTRALIGATLTNQDITTGFFLREVGIFAMDPDEGEILYMYSNAGSTADYITPKGDGVIEKAVNMNVIVGTAANITAGIDESLVYATKKELDEAIAGITIEDASTTKKGITKLSNAVNSISETESSTPKATKTAYDAAVAAQNTANAANQAAATAQSKADQAFQSGNERKAEVVAALVALGVSASTSDTWAVLINKMATVIRATGNATSADLLTGKTASNNSGPITGSMANRGAISQIITTQNGEYTIPQGYHPGTGKVKAIFANLVAENLRDQVTVGGVTGNLKPMIEMTPGDTYNLYGPSTSFSTTLSSFNPISWTVKVRKGVYRIKFNLATNTSGTTAVAQIYKNGVAYGTSRSTSGSGTSTVTFSEDLAFEDGDLIQIYLLVSMSGARATISSITFTGGLPGFVYN